MKYYTYIQNSCGEVIHGAKYVIIEAESPRHANFLAQSRADLYFKFRDPENDCESAFCCKDRWEEMDESLDSGTDEPLLYGEPAAEYQTFDNVMLYRENGERVHLR